MSCRSERRGLPSLTTLRRHLKSDIRDAITHIAKMEAGQSMDLQVTQETCQQKKQIVLDGHSLTIADTVTVARRSQEVSCLLAAEAIQKIEASNALKQQLILAEQPIYGVTTGFGDSCKRQISPAKASLLQKNLVRFLMNGTGPTATKDVARATMLIRANCLARGHSAVRPEIVERLLEYLGYDIVPLMNWFAVTYPFLNRTGVWMTTSNKLCICCNMVLLAQKLRGVNLPI
jgi:hypothetical protein